MVRFRSKAFNECYKFNSYLLMEFKIFKFDEVTSTNDVAINLIKREKQETGYVIAKTQLKGRGTHGKKWVSEKGNFFGSIFFPLKKNYPPFQVILC